MDRLRQACGDSAGSTANAPSHGRPGAATRGSVPPGSRPQLAAGPASPLFFGDVLEHLPVEHQLGHDPLEPLDLGLELATAAIGIGLGRVMPLSPAIIGRLGDPGLAADIGDGQALGQVAVEIPEQSPHFVGGPSLPHGSLHGTMYPGTPISGGPILGEQTTASRSCPASPAGAAPSGRRSTASSCRLSSNSCSSLGSKSRSYIDRFTSMTVTSVTAGSRRPSRTRRATAALHSGSSRSSRNRSASSTPLSLSRAASRRISRYSLTARPGRWSQRTSYAMRNRLVGNIASR